MRIADDVLRQGVQGIADIITVPGLINRDFADVRTVMEGKGHAIMGIGEASGEHRAVEAAQLAIASPLLAETSIEGACGVLINICGDDTVTLNEVSEAAEIITEGTDPGAHVLFGTVIDPDAGDMIKVTVIATGFKTSQEGSQLPGPAARMTPAEPQAPQEEKPARKSVFMQGVANGAYGVNQTEDFEIPAILRKQYD